MPRYYFHFHDGAVYVDREGSELKDEAEISSIAVETMADLMKSGFPHAPDGQTLRLVVADEDGNDVFEVRVTSRRLSPSV